MTSIAPRDGGATWSLELRATPIHGHVEFRNTSDGWASGGRLPNLVKTTDGGHTWSPVTVPTPARSALFAPLVPALVSGNVVISYGAWDTDTGVELRPFFDVTTDGGRTWSVRSGPPGVTVPGGDATGIFSAADTDHWVLGSGNRLYVTDNGGRTWTERAQFVGLATIRYAVRASATAIVVSGDGRGPSHSTEALATLDGGDTWWTASFWAPSLPNSPAVNFPGGIVGCPTRPLSPAPPGNPPAGLVAAAFADIRSVRHWEPTGLDDVYRVGANPPGSFGSLFTFQLPSCGRETVDDSWVVEAHGAVGSGGGGSTPRVQVVLSHSADGWHVFGSYH